MADVIEAVAAKRLTDSCAALAIRIPLGTYIIVRPTEGSTDCHVSKGVVATGNHSILTRCAEHHGLRPPHKDMVIGNRSADLSYSPNNGLSIIKSAIPQFGLRSLPRLCGSDRRSTRG